MKLSILIPTLPERKDKFDTLCAEIRRQAFLIQREDDIMIISDDAQRGVSIGTKRNNLMSQAVKIKSEYVAYIDDDDQIKPDYLQSVMKGIDMGVDACSLRGVITWDGTNPEIYEHSIKYSAWKTNTTGNIKYERYPNHLNCIKTSIASQFKFPETNFGEDHDWSTQVFQSGLIKSEYYIDEVIYHYDYIQNK